MLKQFVERALDKLYAKVGYGWSLVITYLIIGVVVYGICYCLLYLTKGAS